MLLIVALWVLAVVSGSLADGPPEATMEMYGAGVPSLADQQWWTLLTSGLFAADLITYLVVTVLLLVVGIAFEYRWGSVRMAVFTLIVQAVGTALGSARWHWPACWTGSGPGTWPS